MIRPVKLKDRDALATLGIDTFPNPNGSAVR
jgi:hypothetical protein